MADATLALGEDYPEIRAGVRKICEGFPGAYWRDLDERQEYPDAFVKALTEAGYLAALIPESLWRRRTAACAPRARSSRRFTPPAATPPPATRSSTSWARCCGTAARHRSRRSCRRSRRANCGCRPSASPNRRPAPIRRRLKTRAERHTLMDDHYVVHWPESLDLARAAIRSDAAAGAHRTGRQGTAPRRRALGLHRRYPRQSRSRARDQEAAGDDQSQHHRAVLRRAESAGREPSSARKAKASATSSTA